MKNISYISTTEKGKFIIKFVYHYNRNTETLESILISIGSRNKKCVQIKVPSKETNETDAYLMWIESDEDCSLEKYIEKGLAQHMLLLGLTLVRKLNSNIKTVSFEDTSSFLCKLPDNTKIRVPMKLFHIAFHESTWYEYYFNAKLKRNYNEYCKLKENMYNPEYKKKEFEFINQELDDILRPLYNSVTTWHDFFQLISEKYGNKKCSIIYSWISSALNDIFDSNIYEDTRWYIDLKENNKISMIDFKLNHVDKKGGSRKTLKNNKRKFTFSRTHIFPNIPEIEKWNYKNFLKK